MKEVGKRLKIARGKVSQADFAATLGIKPAAYGHYETGRNEPSLALLLQIVELTGRSADWLLGLTDEKQSTSITATGSAVAINGSTATNHPAAVNEAPCPYCAEKDVEIERLNKIIDRLLETTND